ncbi:hypothetical protein MYSE111917_15905 [Mycobacterium senriense]|uniref:Acyltransferase n=1 Tax=Mycobacterium senriense TaxID=2775496 RepID=A0ABM7SM68_9MYCO|nr:hypothetical protein MTY59_06370 [Mycobacterium senriense]
MPADTGLSYGVYIYAFPAQQLLAVGGLAHLQPIVLFLAAAIAALPLAAASWFLIERPSLSLKRRLKRQWSGPLEAESVHQAPTTPP